jgi:hypothetical protein
LKETKAELRRLAQEARAREESAAAGAASEIAIDPAEFLDLQRKLQELEKQVKDNESRRGSGAPEFLEQQVQVHVTAVKEIVTMGVQGNAAIADRNSATLESVSKAFIDHLAAENEKKRLHELQIAEYHRKTAEDAKIAAERNSEIVAQALSGWTKRLENSQRQQAAVRILFI